MSVEPPADLQQLVNAIKQNTTWSGQTTRELRDRVETAAKQVAGLAQSLEASAQRLEGQLSRLTAAVEAGAEGAGRLRKALWMLAVIMALAVLVQLGLAVAARR